jgi:hypothetical protein
MCHTFAPEAGQPVMQLPDDAGRTLREKFVPLETAGVCSYCHKVLNAGFAFDIFDNFGRRYPAQAVPDTETAASFDMPPYELLRFRNTLEAVDGFAAHPALTRCFVTQAYRFAQGRVPGRDDVTALATLEKSFSTDGQSVKRLLAGIARSPAFRSVTAVR